MIVMIAAVAKNNVIGNGNDLPWDIPEDLKYFQNLTRGKTVLMGSKTFQSIIDRIGKPLPKRQNVVITLNKDWQAPPGVQVFNSLDKARQALKDQEVWVIGGGSIYKQMLPYADKIYITHIDMEPKGDAYFPEIDDKEWSKIKEEQHTGFSFLTYERKP